MSALNHAEPSAREIASTPLRAHGAFAMWLSHRLESSSADRLVSREPRKRPRRSLGVEPLVGANSPSTICRLSSSRRSRASACVATTPEHLAQMLDADAKVSARHRGNVAQVCHRNPRSRRMRAACPATEAGASPEGRTSVGRVRFARGRGALAAWRAASSSSTASASSRSKAAIRAGFTMPPRRSPDTAGTDGEGVVGAL